jgi:alpha-beta hydrolase superfamily lysophospholipase
MGRYSESVVASMAEATRTIIAGHQGLEITLVGYSGGGVLALLVADRVPEVTRVVTLAANLDTEKWTARHGYLPLSSSINPAQQPTWRSDLIQIHLTGAQDHNVPPDNHDRLRRGQNNSTFRQISDFSHDCCWVEQWPELLDEAIATQLQPAVIEQAR